VSSELPYPPQPAIDIGELATVGVHDHDGVVVAAIAGEVDISNVEMVARILNQLRNQALGLVVDLTQTTYLDSSGISLLHNLGTRLGQRAQGLAIVCGSESMPYRVLTLTGLDGRVKVLDDVAPAIEFVRESARRGPIP
jgi:anti-anti-sigma factor